MSKWISVTERLPEYEEIILGFQARSDWMNEEEEDQNRIFICSYIDDAERLSSPTFMGLTEWEEIDWEVNYFPTHWMPLPSTDSIAGK